MTVRTWGLTHIALAVSDLDRTARFYHGVFGAREVYRDGAFLQMQTPGSRDVIAFEKNADAAGRKGGALHFGFRLLEPADIDAAAAAVASAGGTVLRRGEFVPGEPYLFAEDPDGYEVEIWYELPTPFDPPSAGTGLP